MPRRNNVYNIVVLSVLSYLVLRGILVVQVILKASEAGISNSHQVRPTKSEWLLNLNMQSILQLFVFSSLHIFCYFFPFFFMLFGLLRLKIL